MTESKYYTPSIEEFHVGFEYEKYDERTATYAGEGSTNWHKHTYDLKSIRLSQLPSHLFEKTIRVKHLDRQDVEECGFEVISETKLKGYDLQNADSHFIRTVLKRAYVDEDVIITIYDKQKVIIRRNNTRNMRAYDKNKTFDVFVGIIKNKSELKRVMKMLCIDQKD